MLRSTATSNIHWVAHTCRALILAGTATALAVNGSLTSHASLSEALSSPLILVIVIAMAWALLLFGLTLLHLPDIFLRSLSFAGDMLLALAFLMTNEGSWAGLIGGGLLPLASGALYFQLIGAGLAATLNMIALGVVNFLARSMIDTLLLLGATVPVYLIAGAGLVSLARLTSGSSSQSKNAAKEKSSQNSSQINSIYNLISAMSASLSFDKVVETALDLSAEALRSQGADADRLCSAILLFDASEGRKTYLTVASARGLSRSDESVSLPAERGLLAQTIDSGKSQRVTSLSGDEEISEFEGLQTCTSAYCIPLRTGLDTCGVLLYAHPDAAFFDDRVCDLLDIVGQQATIAIENARLYQDLEQEKEKMMEIQEEARKKMARDLHDGPTQSVAAIAMRVNFARRLMERDPKATADELFKIEELARRTAKEIRHMLFTLRPLVLESQGLTAALDSMSEKMKETYNQNVIVQVNATLEAQLEMGKQTVIFYISEEAANNARKHAQAQHIWVRLQPAGNELAVLEIEDDGVGFDVGAVDSSYENRGSLGMVNMRERTELLNGVLRIDSAPGRGTRIQVAIPLSEDAADRIRRGQ